MLNSFYTKVDNEASTVLLNHYTKRDDYYKAYLNMLSIYFIGSYNYKNYTNNMTKVLGEKVFTNGFDILLNIDYNTYITSLVNMKQENYIPPHENANRLAQLSFYSSSSNIEKSSYFQHIQNLLLKSSSIVLMQTSLYSSALVNEMLLASYSKENTAINPNKYTIIISNSQDINDFRFKSQKYCFDIVKSKEINSNIVSFYTCYKVNIDTFVQDYNVCIQKCINDIIDTYCNVRKYDYDSDMFNLVTDLIFSIFNYNGNLFLYSYNNMDKFKYNILNSILDNFFVSKSTNILENLTNIVTFYKAKYMQFYLDKEFRSAFSEINNFASNNHHPKYRDYLYAIWNFFGFMKDLDMVVSNYYIPPKDDSLIEHIKEYKEIKLNELNNFFNSSSNDKSIESCIKKDDHIKQICENIINTEYSLDFQSQQIQAYNTFERVITNKFRDDFNNILLRYKEYLIEILPSLDGVKYAELFNISQETIDEFIFNKLRLYLYQNIEDKLPVTIVDIERIFGDKEYYNRICEYIYVKYFQQLYGEKDVSDEIKTIIEYLSKKYLMPVSTYTIIQELAILLLEYIDNLLTIFLKTHTVVSITELFQNPKKLFETYKFNISDIVNLHSKKIINYLVLFSCITLFDDSLFTDNESLSQEKEQEQNDNENNSVDDESDETVENMLKDAEVENSFIKFALDSFIENIKEKTNIEQIIDDIISLENVKDNVSHALTGIIVVSKLFGRTDKQVSMFVFLKGLLNYIDLNSIPEFCWKNRNNLRRVSTNFLFLNQFYETVEEDVEKYTFKHKSVRKNIAEEFKNVKGQLLDDIEQYKYFVKKKHTKLLSYMRYFYYNNKVRLYPYNLSNRKYDKILINYVKNSLAKLHGVDISAIEYKQNFKPNMQYVFTLNDEVCYPNLGHANSYSEFKEEYKKYTNYHKSTSTSNLPNGKNPMKSKLVLGLGNVTASFIVETYIDYKLPIINKDEYERNKDAITYVYTYRRKNNIGCMWVEDKNRKFFTLPKSISQNFIMSDFRAMVVGGAHFDNSCFIKGTSSGIFVQDNEKVTRSFLEIVLDYLDVVKEQQLDVKMGKYLVAYYKVINYLYKIHNYYSISLGKLNILYDNLSRIEEFINSKNLIQKKKGADNENILNINNNNSQTIDNSLMKDFVVQLKRIGESNYKFYETQKPGKEGQASNNNDNSKEGDVQQAQSVQDNGTATDTTTIQSDNNSSVERMVMQISSFEDDEIPVLLGSLIYDEHWFKSTIDDE